MTAKTQTSWAFMLLAALAMLGLAAAPYVIFVLTPIVPSMGLSQKIFYFHVPCAWLMMLSALLSGIGGGRYLFGRRHPGADRFCAVTAELVVIFGLLVMTTGPLWAKRAWGHYWVWDARLTTLLILFLTFVAARLARRYGGPAAGAISAGMALFGAVNVPLVYAAVKIWTTAHPPTTVTRTLSPALQPAFWLSLAAFTALYGLLLWSSLAVERQRAVADALRLGLTERRARLGRATRVNEARQ